MPKKVTLHEATTQPSIQSVVVAPFDKRILRSRTTILATAAELLFEKGFAGVSVDEIARRSGIAKATIYRHWATKTDLLRDTCSMIGTPLTLPDSGSLKSDLTILLIDLANILKNEKWTSVLPSIIDAAERNPDIADMYRNLQIGYSEPLKTVILRAVARGEIDPKTDVAVLIAALTGPLFYRRWFTRDALTPNFAKQIVQLVSKDLQQRFSAGALVDH